MKATSMGEVLSGICSRATRADAWLIGATRLLFISMMRSAPIAIYELFTAVPRSVSRLISLRLASVKNTVIKVESVEDAFPPVNLRIDGAGISTSSPDADPDPDPEATAPTGPLRRVISSSTMVFARTVSSKVSIRAPIFMSRVKLRRIGAVVSLINAAVCRAS